MDNQADISTAILMCKDQLYSAVIADTLDALGYNNQVVDSGIVPIDPSLVLCGLARVGLYMPIYHDDENVNVYEKEIALVDSLKPDEVAVLVCHDNQRIVPWGELLSERSVHLGAAGCLTDGCIRDSREIIALKFPVFSKGTSPADTKYRGKMMMSDVPGEIGSVRINSGDLVFGDRDGVVIVPKEIILGVIARALQKSSAENTVRNEIRNGDTLTNIFDRHGVL